MVFIHVAYIQCTLFCVNTELITKMCETEFVLYIENHRQQLQRGRHELIFLILSNFFKNIKIRPVDCSMLSQQYSVYNPNYVPRSTCGQRVVN